MRSDDEGARSSSTACRRRHQATASNKRLSARSASGVPNTAATSSGGSDAPFRLSRAGHDGASGPDDAYARRHFGSGVAGLLPTITVWRIRMEAAL